VSATTATTRTFQRLPPVSVTGLVLYCAAVAIIVFIR
jgi:hypothetical protein